MTPPPPSLLGNQWLSFLAPVAPGTCTLPVSVISPPVYDAFARELGIYPTAKKAFVLDGIRYGFRVGFDAALVQLQTKSSNLRSCFDHPDVVDAYLAQEVQAGRVAGPFRVLLFHSCMSVRLASFPNLTNQANGG